MPIENFSQTLQDLFNLNGRVAVITGGAGLLGAEFCRTLAEAGAHVVIADINADAAEKVAGNIKAGHQVISVQTDLSDRESVHGMVSTTLETFGRLDILVNSAAICAARQPSPQCSNKEAV